MSKSENRLPNTHKPREWFRICPPFKVRETPGQPKILWKYFWKAAEILGSILAASLFIMITLWVMKMDHTVLLTELHTEVSHISKTPAIVWYTPEVGIPLNKEIICVNGSNLLKCKVFLRQSQPDRPEAFLFYAPYLTRFPLPRDSKVMWGLLHDESPVNNLIFMHEEALNLFNFSATFSRYSDVPFPVINMRGLDRLTSTRYYTDTKKKNIHLKNLAPVVYLQSNWLTSTERDSYVAKLMEYIQIDCYGGCLNNKNLPINQVYADKDRHDYNIYRNYLNDPELLQFLSRYKFMVTIENAVCDDYTSEKLWRALEVGVVPIYFGSSLIRDWLPNNKSAILLEDYPTPELLSQHLNYLLQNDSAYDQYLAHKTLGQISNQKLINEMRLRPYQSNLKTVVEKFECFVCEMIHEEKNNEVNIMTRKQYDCPPATAALSPNTPSSDITWHELIKQTKPMINSLYDELWNPDRTVRCSNTSWRKS